MKKISFQEAVQQIVASDTQYDAEAYFFIREALDFTISMFEKPLEGPARHVSGSELLNGIRKYALKEFGPLTMTVLNRWGIKACEDFGEVVFLMVEHGILGKTDDDRKEDFAGGYDFIEAFRKPFLPEQVPGVDAPARPTRAS